MVFQVVEQYNKATIRQKARGLESHVFGGSRTTARIDPSASVDLISSFSLQIIAVLQLVYRYTLSIHQNTHHGSSTNVTTNGSASRHPPTAHHSPHHVLLDTLTNVPAASSAKVVRFRDRDVPLLRPRLIMVGSRRSLSHSPRNESSASRLHSTLSIAVSKRRHKTTRKAPLPRRWLRWWHICRISSKTCRHRIGDGNRSDERGASGGQEAPEKRSSVV